MLSRSQSYFTGLLAIVVVSVACRAENTAATGPISPPELSVRSEPSTPFFSADVEVSIAAARLAEVSAEAPPQRLSYHVERLRNDRGEWKTVYSNLVLPSDRLNSEVRPEFHPARFEIDDAGRMSAFNDLSNLLDSRFPGILDSLRPRERISREALSRLQTELRAALPNSATNGIQRFLLDRPAQQAMIAKLAARGRVVRDDGGRVIYETRSPNGAVHFTIDKALGAIIASERHPVAGPVTRLSSEFAEIPPGRLVRTHARFEREMFRNVPAVVVDTRISNISLVPEAK